jgi:uncharacterized protein (TIGR03067 family)
MRLPTFLLAMVFAVGCASTQYTGNNNGQLNGTWIPVKQEMGGTALPEIIYKTQQLIISDSNYTVTAESIDKGVVRYNADKMDIYGKEGVNKGKHFTAIYKYTNGELTVCYNLLGTDYPAKFETAGKPLYFLSVFKKQNQ